MLGKDLLELNLNDIELLIENGVRESKRIEYKQTLPENSDSGKKEFLADISSFANSGGGDVIYGIACADGLPTHLAGIETDNIDATVLRYESIIKDGLSPRINSNIHWLELETNRFILIIRVASSWNAPHRVIFKGHDKFFGRNSAGKYPLDVTELRSAFTRSLLVEQKIRTFIEDRVRSIFLDQLPIKLAPGPRMILHLVPLAAFDSNVDFDIFATPQLTSRLRPMGRTSGWNHRINLEGFLTTTAAENQILNDYTQLFRNGIIEAVNSSLLVYWGDEKAVPSLAYEQRVVESLNQYVPLLKDIGVDLPIVVYLSFTGLKGYKLGLDSNAWNKGYLCDRDIVELPEGVILDWHSSPEELMLPIFNAFWNTFGFQKSLNFDDNGHWRKS